MAKYPIISNEQNGWQVTVALEFHPTELQTVPHGQLANAPHTRRRRPQQSLPQEQIANPGIGASVQFDEHRRNVGKDEILATGCRGTAFRIPHD